MKNHFRIYPGLFFLAALFILVTGQLLASQDKADSLKQIVRANPDNKTAVDNLLALTQYYYDEYLPDSATKYAEQALALSTRLDYPEGIAESTYKFYMIEYRKTDYNAAKAYLIRFNQVGKKLNNDKLLGKGYYAYGMILSNRGDLDSALYYIHKSLEINRKLNDTNRLIANYNSIGNIFLNQAEQDSAAYFYLEAARLAELKGQTKFLGPIYNNIGESFNQIKEFDNARFYLEKALEINKKSNDLTNLSGSYSKLGDNYLNQNDLENAMRYYDLSMEINQKLDNRILMADIYNNYAVIYDNQEKYQPALENYFKALATYREQSYTEGMTNAMMNIGHIYSLLGKYEIAAIYLDSALVKATADNFQQNQCDILRQISSNYYMAGKYKDAYDNLDMYHSLYDSLMNVEKTTRLNELEKKYQKEKDQAIILTLEKENLNKTIQRNVVIYTSIGLIMLAIFIIIYFRQKARKDRIIAQHQIRQLEEEKKLISARLLIEGQEEERKRIARELHDGLGVILSATKLQFTSIRDLSPENQPLIERATQLLEQASGDVRRVSHNMMPGLLTKMGFFEAADDLIESISDKEGLKAACEITGSQERLPENIEIMLYRIVQEMVNNTLKHAKARNIDLKINRSEALLELSYSDDGTGFEPDKILGDLKSSLGLQSIRSRVDYLNGELKIDSAPGSGTHYFIRVPV